MNNTLKMVHICFRWTATVSHSREKVVDFQTFTEVDEKYWPINDLLKLRKWRPIKWPEDLSVHLLHVIVTKHIAIQSRMNSEYTQVCVNHLKIEYHVLFNDPAELRMIHMGRL